MWTIPQIALNKHSIHIFPPPSNNLLGLPFCSPFSYKLILVYFLCVVIWLLLFWSSTHYANPTGMVKGPSDIEQNENLPQEARVEKVVNIYTSKILSVLYEYTSWNTEKAINMHCYSTKSSTCPNCLLILASKPLFRLWWSPQRSHPSNLSLSKPCLSLKDLLKSYLYQQTFSDLLFNFLLCGTPSAPI